MSKNENLKPFAIDAGKASVAVAVASLCAVSAQASTFSTGLSSTSAGRNISLEVMKASAGATSGALASTALTSMTMTLGASYGGNDTLTLSIGGTAGSPQLADAYGTMSCGGTTWLNQSKSATSQKFRVPTGSSFTTNTACTVGGLYVLDSSITSTGTITFAGAGAIGDSIAQDTADAASSVFTVQNAYAVYAKTALSKSVDSKYANKTFKNGATQDSLVLGITSNAVLNPAIFMGGLTGSDTAAATIDILGDFTFLVNGAETVGTALGSTNSAEISASSAGSVASLSALGTTASVTGLRLSLESSAIAAVASAQTVTITGAASSGNALKAQTFASSPWTLRIQTPRYPSVPYSITGTYSPGLWQQTGTIVFIPYMPVGSGITQVVYLANNSSTSTGVANIVMKSQAGGSCSASSVALNANGNTNLSDAIASAIATCQAAGTVAATDKLMITITATTPLANTEVYSSFTVGGSSRVSIVNSSNGYRVSGSGIGGSNADNSL